MISSSAASATGQMSEWRVQALRNLVLAHPPTALGGPARYLSGGAHLPGAVGTIQVALINLRASLVSRPRYPLSGWLPDLIAGRGWLLI
jgi:hypothetical protein